MAPNRNDNSRARCVLGYGTVPTTRPESRRRGRGAGIELDLRAGTADKIVCWHSL